MLVRAVQDLAKNCLCRSARASKHAPAGISGAQDPLSSQVLCFSESQTLPLSSHGSPALSQSALVSGWPS